MALTSVSFKQWRLFIDGFKSFSFIIPALFIFAVFYIYPFIEMFRLSLYQWPGIGPKVFVGLDNFKDVLQDKVWWDAFFHAGYITLVALTLQNILAFFLALACDRQIRLRRYYQLVFFIPPVLSEVVVGMIWNWILNGSVVNGQPVGLLNHVLVHTGFPQLVRHWLSDPATALSTIALVHAWKGFGWGFILLLAGLSTIDRSLYEAAKVDGANAFSLFRHITMPLMLPVVLVVMLLTILGSMQVFILIFSLVNQGLVYHTEVPVTRILGSMSGMHQFGYACAQAIIFGSTLIAVSFLFKLFSDRMKKA